MGLFGLGKKPGLGIDIATDAVKAVELLPHEDTYQVIGVAEHALPKSVITEDEIVDIEKLAKIVVQARKKLSGKTKDVVSAVSGNLAISKQIAVSADLDDEAIAEKIEAEAEALIPFPLNEVRYDFESLGDHPTILGQQRVLVTATRMVSVDTRVQVFEDAGLNVTIMDVDNQAILRACNYLLPHLQPEVASSKLPILVLDIGMHTTQTIVLNQGEVSFNRFQSGGIVSMLSSLDQNGAVEHGELLAKLRANELEDLSDLFIQDYLGNLWSQTNRGVQMYQSGASDKTFAALVVVNIGAMIPVVLESLNQQVSYPVIALNPFDHFPLPEKLQHLHDHGPRFVEAVGLALRSFTPWHT
ncbi:hypothetical protein CWE22_11210 [Pseudidiomarina aestuarii]|uniref:SHS2 domain-containing protein n=1 Tax=Pseudidiomarina aestuarii TaxID=624146 RepID=A0A7Z6ZRR7_9GAMM|nr:type IV pilus assembly protein PilM [Pseudidiomarina aestuarii]RUO38987.1 hypothetical protein CWE22_11210 [Pseudidiomarina aestuarii]